MSRQLPWSNTPQAQPLSERKAVQPYQYSVATDGYFVPNRSTYYWGSPSDMVFNSQPTHQGMSPETWNTSKSARNELYQHRPPHPQHFLPYYAHSWKQNEPTPATTVQMHGYAALTQQPTQAPLAGTEVESDHCGRSHPTAATNATTSSWRQPANTSRSRRTSRTTYAHNSPGPPKASPVQRLSDASGKEIMRFEYTMNRKKTQVELRCDIEHIDIASLSAAFKRDHACYKDAGDGNIDEAIIRARMYERGKTEGKMRTRFRRMKYEADCNRIGWRLVMLNAEKLAGHKGMIQRAADSYRNSSSDLDKRSRRLNREITKARRRAAVEEASRHESIGPITEEHFSVSPTDHAAQSPQSLAFPSHQSYGSGYGFGPGNSVPTTYPAYSSTVSPETDARFLSSASATMPSAPHDSAQVLAASNVRPRARQMPGSYGENYDGYYFPQTIDQLCDNEQPFLSDSPIAALLNGLDQEQ